MENLNCQSQCELFDTYSNRSSSTISLSVQDIGEVKKQEQNKMKLIPLKLNKSILKSRKNPKKGYVRKQFEMVPLLLKEISSFSKYLLFGFQEIETYYKDYSNPYDVNLVDYSDALIGISSIENKKDKNELQINLFSKGSSGITEFQFLIDHFKQFTTEDYRKLHQELIKFQQLAIFQRDHYNELKVKVKSRIITTEDIQKAQEDFMQFVDKYAQAYTEQNYFYVYEMYAIDFETMDISPIRKCISLALMSLLGVEPSDYEQFIYHQGDIFQASLGRDRMVELLDMIDIFANGNTYKCTDSHIKTIDNIKIATKLEQEIIYWNERPEWATCYDYILIAGKFDLSAQKIKSVIEQRQRLNRVEADLEILECMQFDYVVKSEIFLEKYYPEAYQNLKEKKSIRSSFKISENDKTEVLIE